MPVVVPMTFEAAEARPIPAEENEITDKPLPPARRSLNSLD